MSVGLSLLLLALTILDRMFHSPAMIHYFRRLAQAERRRRLAESWPGVTDLRLQLEPAEPPPGPR